MGSSMSAQTWIYIGNVLRLILQFETTVESYRENFRLDSSFSAWEIFNELDFKNQGYLTLESFKDILS